MLIDNFAKLFLIIASSLLGVVENRSIFGIGTRIIGDQLLVKDVLEAPPTGWSYISTIRFNYAIPEPITYVEIISEENVLAEVNFSYKNDLVVGTITAINKTELISTTPASDDYSTSTLDKFHVLITIYGFNETVLNLNSGYVLNRDQDFQGILEPQQSDEEYYNLSNEEQFSEVHTVTEDFNDNDDDTYGGGIDDNDESDDDDNDFDRTDNIIELGHRQMGDYQIYETFQTSLTTTQDSTNHSVVFYYIDRNYITHAKFVIYDHSNEKSSGPNAPIAEYSHFSPSTLKAIITDYKTTSLFVHMFLYGYKPEDLPVDYEPYLASSQRAAEGSTALPMSALQRLKLLMNAQRRGGTDAAPAPKQIQDYGEDKYEDVNNGNDHYMDSDTIARGKNGSKISLTCQSAAAILIPVSGGTSSLCTLVAYMFLINKHIQC